MRVKPVIMAGGHGTRLWPVSSIKKPKQFLNILKDLSLLQQTLIRNQTFGSPLIITSAGYESITKKQTQNLNIKAKFVIEPLLKNTAICAVITALIARKQGFDTVILLPADHYIFNKKEYEKAINLALNYTQKLGICTIGLPIKAPNSEYGYISAGGLIAPNIYQTNKFIEKPNLEKAHYYMMHSKHFWNSGIYVYDINFLIAQVNIIQPDLLAIAKDALKNVDYNDNSLRLNENAYNQVQAASLDQAVIEHIPQMIMILGNFEWSDLGTWRSVWEIMEKDKLDNYCEGNVVTSNITNSYISSDNKLTMVIGLDNVIVINTKKGLLVADKSQVNKVKQLLFKVKSE